MAIGSGLGASFGISAEGTYGTYVAPARWWPGTQFFVKPDIQKTPVQGLAAGRLGPGIDEVITGKSGTGQWQGQFPTNKMGLFLSHLMGSAPTPTQQAATAAYLANFTVADNFGKYLTAQAGVPLTTGTVQAYTGTGGKVTALELSSDINGVLNATADFWFQNVVDSQALAAPSYTAYGVLNALAVKIGTFNSEAAVTGVRSANVKLERVLDGERPGLPGAYPEPIMVEQGFKVTGTINPDFTAKADWADRFIAGTSTALVLEWTGSLIASTYYNTVRVRCPKVFFRDAVPGVDGPEVVKGSVAFEAFLDTTNGLALLDIISTDTTLL